MTTPLSSMLPGAVEDRTDLARLAEGLTPRMRELLLSFDYEPRQMGIGMEHSLPGMVEADGLNHPIFGPHYRRTSLGQQVAQHLKDNNHDRS